MNDMKLLRGMLILVVFLVTLPITFVVMILSCLDTIGGGNTDIFHEWLDFINF